MMSVKILAFFMATAECIIRLSLVNLQEEVDDQDVNRDFVPTETYDEENYDEDQRLPQKETPEVDSSKPVHGYVWFGKPPPGMFEKWPFGKENSPFESGKWPFDSSGSPFESKKWPFNFNKIPFKFLNWPFGHLPPPSPNDNVVQIHGDDVIVGGNVKKNEDGSFTMQSSNGGSNKILFD